MVRWCNGYTVIWLDGSPRTGASTNLALPPIPPGPPGLPAALEAEAILLQGVLEPGQALDLPHLSRFLIRLGIPGVVPRYPSNHIKMRAPFLGLVAS